MPDDDTLLADAKILEESLPDANPTGVRLDVDEDEAVGDEVVGTRRWPQYLAASAATMVAMAGGTVLAWTSPAVPMLQKPDSPFRLNDDQASWVGAIMPLGAVFGAPPAGIVAQRLGRKVAVLSLSAPLLLSWLLVLTTRSPSGLYAARWLAGFALGGVCVACPIYVAEVAEDAIRGTCGALLQVMFNAGMLFSYAVGALESYTALAWACAAVPALFLAVFVWMPETPATLLARGGDGEVRAARALGWLRGVRDPSPALDQLMERLRRAQALAKARPETGDDGEGVGSRMWQPPARRAMVISMGLVAAQQLSGVCVVVFYAEHIFRSAGSTLSPNALAVSVGVVMLIMSYVTTLVVDRVGRRTLLVLSASFMGLSLVSLAAFFQLQATSGATVDTGPFAWLPVVAVIVFIVTYCLGLGPLPWTVMAEVLPPDVKGPGGSVVSSFCWLLSFCVTKSFHTLVDAFGMHSAFWLFAAFCGVTVVFVVLIVPETRGKSLQQIQSKLARL